MQPSGAGVSTAVSGQEEQVARLRAGLEMLRIDASDVQRRHLTSFIAMLVKWNSVFNLTAVRDAADMLAVHVLDALSIVGLVEQYARNTVLDVGSGAGIPAIPLAIIRPDLAIHSVDAVAKKIGFQLQVRAALPLTNLHPRHARIESLKLPDEPSVIVSRAFSAIPNMLDAVDHLSGRQTTVIAMKGQEPANELAALPSGWVVDRVVRLEVPFLGALRCAVVLKQTS